MKTTKAQLEAELSQVRNVIAAQDEELATLGKKLSQAERDAKYSLQQMESAKVALADANQSLKHMVNVLQNVIVAELRSRHDAELTPQQVWVGSSTKILDSAPSPEVRFLRHLHAMAGEMVSR